MWGRFGQRRRSKRGQAVERATNALRNVWGRFGEGRTGRKERAYGSAVWLGAGGVLAMATLILLLLWLLGRGRRSREESAPTSPVPEVPEEDVEAVPPGGWYHLLLQVRKMFPQGRNHLRARNAPRGAGKRPPPHQPREKNRRRARSGPEADKGYLTLREGATRYGQFPRRTLLGSS